MARKNRSVGGDVSINMTPMIDCTFQLILFFLLAAKLASQDLEPMLVAEPYDSVAIKEDKDKGGKGLDKMPNKIIVNVVSEYGNEKERPNPDKAREATKYVIRKEDYDVAAPEKLVEFFKKWKKGLIEQKFDKWYVEVRSDKDIQYYDVQPVLEAAARAGIPSLFITAIANKDKIVKVN